MLICNIIADYYTIAITYKGLLFLCLTSIKFKLALTLLNNNNDNYILTNNSSKCKALLFPDLRDCFGIKENFLFC